MDMDFGYIVTVLGIILVSMMLHELMHGFVALKLGDETARLLGRLTFNPLKHIDPIMTIALPLLIIVTNAMTGAQTPVFGGAKPVPFNPANIRHDEWGVALMALAGPLTNFGIAFIAFLIVALGGIAPETALGTVLTTTVWVNLGFFVFNILPIPPLDGSRFMYAIAPDFVRKVMDVIEQYGTFLVFALVVVFNDVLTQYFVSSISWIIQLFSRLVGVV
jgi:Zn-dependent protease